MICSGLKVPNSYQLVQDFATSHPVQPMNLGLGDVESKNGKVVIKHGALIFSNQNGQR